MDRKAFISGIIVLFECVLAVHLQASVDYPYEYDFVSANSEVTGKLFLDEASSSQGSVADIGPGSYLTFNLYNGYLPAVTFSLSSLSTSQDPSLTFAWNASQITTPLDLAVGLGNNDVLLSREFLNSANNSSMAPEYDAVKYYDVFAAGNQNLLNGQALGTSMVSLVATEETMDVGGGGVIYNIPFDPGSNGVWMAMVPEPSQIALMSSLGALAFGLLGGGRWKESILRTFLRSVLRRLPPNRG